jgi:hypothetical protein
MGPQLVTNFGQIHCRLYRGKVPWVTTTLWRIAKTSCLYAMADRNPARYKHLYDMDSGFWRRGWHITWRKGEFKRIYDTVSSKCKGEALLCIEDNGMKSAANICAILKHEFGGAGEAIKLREKMFDLCIPSISEGYRLNVERMSLGELCPS